MLTGIFDKSKLANWISERLLIVGIMFLLSWFLYLLLKYANPLESFALVFGFTEYLCVKAGYNKKERIVAYLTGSFLYFVISIKEINEFLNNSIGLDVTLPTHVQSLETVLILTVVVVAFFDIGMEMVNLKKN